MEVPFAGAFPAPAGAAALVLVVATSAIFDMFVFLLIGY
jgi:hypothetical protein